MTVTIRNVKRLWPESKLTSEKRRKYDTKVSSFQRKDSSKDLNAALGAEAARNPGRTLVSPVLPS